MRHPDEQVELSEEKASAGQKGTGMRYVLMISLVAAIAILSIIWIVPAANAPSVDQAAVNNGEISR